MLITSIRNRVKSELDTRRSASFMRYLMHFLQMFAFLGMIIPILAGIDYFCTPTAIEESVIKKYSNPTLTNINHIEYHVVTDSYSFISDALFYANVFVGDKITYFFAPIFHTATNVTIILNNAVYKCEFANVYGWGFIIVCITFVFSSIVIKKTWRWMRKWEYIKYDSAVNVGIINVFLCLMTLIAILFHII